MAWIFMVLEHPEQASLIWGWQGLLPYVSEVLTELNNLYLYSFLNDDLGICSCLQMAQLISRAFFLGLHWVSQTLPLFWMSVHPVSVKKIYFFILAKRNLKFSVSWSLGRSYQDLSDTHCRTFSPTYSKIRECMYVFDIHAQDECVYWLWFSAFILWALFATCLIHKHTIFFSAFSTAVLSV